MIETFGGQQRVVITALNDLPLIDDNDLIGIAETLELVLDSPLFHRRFPL